MKRLIASAILAIAALAGCASTPQTPAQAVYAVHGNYTVALTAAVKYKALPACTKPPATPVCKKPEVVAQLQKADDAAFQALQVAQRVVRAPPGQSALETALANANQAVAAFATIVKTLGVN